MNFVWMQIQAGIDSFVKNFFFYFTAIIFADKFNGNRETQKER